jgi:hypothetical protein
LRTTRSDISLILLVNFASIFSAIFEREKSEGGLFRKLARGSLRGTAPGDPGWSNCVFCGTAVGKAARSREYIIPMWLLRATGDPHRKIKIDSDPVTGADIVRPASTFHFPACEKCNETYGRKLETQAKRAVEALFAGRSLAVSQCYWLLDWLDKVRVGLWLGYNMLHKEEFAPKFRIDQRIGIKDRIAIISVDPNDATKGFGFGGLDNQIFRTSQAGMFFRINNIRILSLSFDGLISRFAGMPFPEKMLALSDDPDRLMAIMGRTDYKIKQNWKEFQIPGATVIAQASFWFWNCADDKSFDLWINENTIPRFKKVPRLRKAADLNQFVQTLLISNATGDFQYHRNSRQRLPKDSVGPDTNRRADKGRLVRDRLLRQREHGQDLLVRQKKRLLFHHMPVATLEFKPGVRRVLSWKCLLGSAPE